jgi:hypothetical protein
VVVVKKSATGGGAPSLDILAAKLRIVEGELYLDEYEVKLDNGRSFLAEPNLNTKIEVVKNLVEPSIHEGAVFFDRFKLKQDDDGDWALLKYSNSATSLPSVTAKRGLTMRTPSSRRPTSSTSRCSKRCRYRDFKSLSAGR